MKPPNLSTETAAALEKVLDLLGAVRRHDTAFADAVMAGGAARVTIDFRERLILIGVTDEDGRARTLLAIQADVFDRAAFGDVGLPEPVAGLYRGAGVPH